MLQEHCHVERDVADVVLDHDVFCVEDVGVAEAVPELAPEFVERGVMLVGAAFDLNRADCVASSHEEVDLHSAGAIPLVRP